MPQIYDDGPKPGTISPPKKKKTPPPAPTPRPTVLPATDTSVGGNQGTLTTKQLNPDKVRLVGPHLGKRATALDPRLTSVAPEVAAALISSGMPTGRLAQASSAIYEAQSLAHERYGWLYDFAKGIETADSLPEGMRTGAVGYLQFIHENYSESEGAILAVLNGTLSAEAKENAIRQIVTTDIARTDIVTPERIAQEGAFLALFDTGRTPDPTDPLAVALAGDVSTMGMDPLAAFSGDSGRLISNVGRGMNPLDAAFDIGGRIGRGIGAEGLTEKAGGYATGAGESFMRGVRSGIAVVGSPIAIGAGLIDEDQDVMGNLESLAKSAWDLETPHGPTATLLIQMGVDEDSEALDVFDFMGDTAGGFALAGGFSAIKAGRAAPLESGIAGGRFSKLFQRGVEEWSNTGRGQRTLADVVKINLKNPELSAGVLLQKYRGRMTQRLAEKISVAKTVAEARRILIEDVLDHPTDAKTNALHAERRKLNDRLKDGTESADPLIAKIAEIDAKLGDYARYQPVDVWPTRPVVSRFLEHVPGNNWVRRTAESLYIKTGVSPSKFTNDLPTKPVLRSTRRATPTEMASNVHTIQTYLKLARVPAETVARVLNDFAKRATKSQQKMFDWYDDTFIPAVEEGLSRGGKRQLDFQTIQNLRSSLRRGQLEATRSPIVKEVTRADGTRSTEIVNVLEDQVTHRPRPTQPNEVVGDIVLPDVEFIRHSAQSILNGDKLPAALRPGYDATKWVASLPFRAHTAGGKPLVLAGVPRLIARATLFEQSLRNIGYGNTPLALLRRLRNRRMELGPGGTPRRASAGKTGAELREGLGPDPLGTLLGDEFAAGEKITVPVDTAEFGPSGAASVGDRIIVAKALADQVVHLADDEMASMVARDGAAATLRYMEEHPESELGRFFREDGPELWEGTHADVSMVEPSIPEGTTRLYSVRRHETPEQVRTRGLVESGTTSFGERPAVFFSRKPPTELAPGEFVAEVFARPENIIPSTGTPGINAVMTRSIPPEQIVRIHEGGVPPGTSPAMRWLAEKEAQINQIAGGDPVIRDAIGHHRVENVAPEGAARQALLDDRLLVDEAIAEAKRSGDGIKTMELRRRRNEIDDTLDTPETASFDVSDIGRLKNEILTRMNDTYTLPERVLTTRNAKLSDLATKRERIDAMMVTVSKTLYKPLKWWGRADVALTRGSMFFQELLRYEKRLLDIGYPKEMAFRMAQSKAAFLTRDRMYDLAARSSFDRATKHIFWFAPAAREIAATWFYRIPGRSYWPVGMARLMFQGKITVDLLQDTGIMKTREYDDGTKKHYITFPNPFNDETIEMSLDSLLSITPVGGIPVTLTPMAQLTGENVPFLKGVTKAFSFSEDISFFPGSLKKTWNLVTGEPFPLDFLSKEAEERAITIARDKALQLAASELIGRGDTMPMQVDFESEAEYKAARDAWLKRLNREADSMHIGTSLVQLSGMLLGPASMTQVTPERMAYEEWQKENKIAWPFTDAEYDKIDAYVLEHPEAAPFTISYWEHGANTPGTPVDEPFWDQVQNGEIFAGDPEEYALELQARLSMSYEYSLLDRDMERNGFGKDVTLEETLRRSGDYDKIMDAHQRRQDEYFAMNPEVEAWWEDNREKMNELYGEAPLTAEQENLSTLYRLLDQNSSYFLGAGGRAAEGWGELNAKIRERMAAFPEPTTELGTQRAWWFDNVLSPYMDKIGPLYDEAERLAEAGLDASSVYDKIRKIANNYGPINKFGQNLPSAEEFLLGGKTDRARTSTTAGWASRPPTWLTDFQLAETYGKKYDFPKRDQFLDYVRQVEDAYYEVYGQVTTDAQKESLKKQRAAMLNQIASYYDPAAKEMIRLLDAPPVVRLSTAGFGQNNKNWKWAQTYAVSLANALEAEGLNPAYDSELALKWKVPFLQELERRRKADPAFDRLWDTLSFAVPEKGYDQRRDIPLYVAILFDQFGGTYYSPDDLIALVERGN